MSVSRVIILFFIIQISCGITLSETLKQDEVTQNITSNVLTKKLDKICDLCTCKDFILNCTNRAVTKNFTEYEWPGKLIEALFINSSIQNITQFPTIEVNKLTISKNSIRSIAQAAFKNISNLTELNLSNNNLTHNVLQSSEFEGNFEPVARVPLPHLIVLDLSNNLLHRLDQDIFEHMVEIKQLILKNNPLQNLTTETGKAFMWLRKLEYLDLNNCGLKQLPHKLDYVYKDLKFLDLSNNLFESPPFILEAAVNLETLIMDGNPITIINKDNAYRTMLKLTNLSMNNMPNLQKIEAGSLSNMPMLRNLSIANNPKLFYISGDSLVNHNNTRAYVPLLKVLELSNNSLNYLPLELAQWNQLEELHLIGNHWICDCDNDNFIKSFLPTYGSKLLKNELNLLVCENPPDFKDRRLVSLEKTFLRCLNFYEVETSNEAVFLVGILIGLLTAIPIILAVLVFWRKGYFVCGTKPGSYSRAFYKRTMNDDDL